MASRKVCFVISPSDEEGTPAQHDVKILLDYVIKPALEKYNFEVIRAIDFPRADRTTPEKIIHLIQTAELCIIMLSPGSDSDLYYQTGRRHETGRPYIHIVKQGEEVPLNYHPVTTVMYDDISSTESAFRTIWSIQRYVDEFERTNYGWSEGTVSLSAIAALTNRIDSKLSKLLESPALLPSGRSESEENQDDDVLDISPFDDILNPPGRPDDTVEALDLEDFLDEDQPPADFHTPVMEALVEMSNPANLRFEDLDLASFTDFDPLDSAAPDVAAQDEQAAGGMNGTSGGLSDELDVLDFSSLIGANGSTAEESADDLEALDLDGLVGETNLIDEAEAVIAAGDYERAMDYLPKIEAQQGHSEVLLQLASQVASAGIEAAAAMVYRLLNEYRGGFSREAIGTGVHAAADFYIQTRREREGLARIHALVRNIAMEFSADPEFQAYVLYQLQRVAFSGADYARAREVALRVLQLAPGTPDYLFGASRIYEKLGQLPQAVEHIDQYMTAGASLDADHLTQAISIYTRVGRQEDARAAYARLSRVSAERARQLLADPRVREMVGG